MKIFLSILLCAMSVSSCSVINYIAQKKESGKAFCNEQYLDENIIHFNKRELNVARNGFVYSTLGAIALQKNNYESRSHLFKLPNNIKEIYSDNKLSGLQAKTFIVLEKITNNPKELVVAFAGTNQFRDWLTNAQVSDKQFKQAVDYYNTSVQLKEVGDPKKIKQNCSNWLLFRGSIGSKCREK